jgi:hypothetical protein
MCLQCKRNNQEEIMASSFTWLDYSEHDRRKMLDVIELFGERTTRDELGLGGVRDAFADLLFPGTSTIQTRAKYFLFVPWIYLILEDKDVPSSAIARRVQERCRTLQARGQIEKGMYAPAMFLLHWIPSPAQNSTDFLLVVPIREKM